MRSNTGKNIKLKTGKSNLDIVKSYLNGERAFVQVGYDPILSDSNRIEGDQWEDGQGKKWVMKNGCRQLVPKVARFINEQRCKTCNTDVRWGNYLDDQVWPKTHLCYDCFINNETRMKIDGTWEYFDKARDLRNERSITSDYKKKFDETLKWCNEHENKPLEFINEDGSIEKWDGVGGDIEKIRADVSKDLDFINARLSEIDGIIADCEAKYESTKLQRSNKG